MTPAVTARTVDLITVNDNYNGQSISGQKMFVKIQGSSEKDLFVMYNKAEGITEDIVSEYRSGYGNHVVIVEQTSDLEQSWVKASLSAGQTYSQSNYAGGRLSVKVCSITAGSPDVAKVVIWVNGKTSEPSCDGNNNNDDDDNTPSPTCSDTCSYRFNLDNGGQGSCVWITKNQNWQVTKARKAKYCGRSAIKSNCPATCDAACGNDKSFTFTLRNVGKSVPCKWIVQNRKKAEIRKGNYCGNALIASTCPSACGRCPY